MSVFAHWFWSLLALACLLWYATVAVVVAIKGALDIFGMLSRLRQGQEEKEEGGTPS
ncbi:MAG TPA: hypothetical protein PLC40_08045 [Candidatus Hydrogenedentes bacterium]|nr:MAG: hypothetical protein BWY09_00712 [Candidatus Hydrogenedentes bacterium ADurb.Bin179]HOH29610.1 hypothetical protein [Candidatus Hydrogenedentota bacterium]